MATPVGARPPPTGVRGAALTEAVTGAPEAVRGANPNPNPKPEPKPDPSPTLTLTPTLPLTLTPHQVRGDEPAWLLQAGTQLPTAAVAEAEAAAAAAAAAQAEAERRKKARSP